MGMFRPMPASSTATISRRTTPVPPTTDCVVAGSWTTPMASAGGVRPETPTSPYAPTFPARSSQGMSSRAAEARRTGRWIISSPGLDAVGFVDRTGGDYRLSATSPYKNAGTDGKDPGADIDALNLATVCVVGGACAPPPDVTPPTVSITAPTAGATVAGNVTVSASASDNAGVAGVQFKLDGANLGAEVSVPPYTVVWPTTLVPNGDRKSVV